MKLTINPDESSHAIHGEPSAWVMRFLHLMPQHLPVLDLACGSGRHCRALLGAGHQVLGVDRDAAALAQVETAGEAVKTQQIDLEATDFIWPFAAGSFAGIVVCNYLHRPLLPMLAHSLAPGGVLIYETFAQGNAEFGKPSNPDFLLQTGELLDFARQTSLRVIAFEEGRVDQPKSAMVQRICCLQMGGEISLAQLGPI